MELHHHVSQRMEPRQLLSRRTPVLENLTDDFERFYTGVVASIVAHKITEVDVVGESGIGKGAIVEQMFKRLETDNTLRKWRREGGPLVTYQYYSLATEFQDAVREKNVVSPWGTFTPEQLAEAAVVADTLGQEKLQKADQAPKPIARLKDFVAVSEPIDLGGGHIRRSARRAKEDPSYAHHVLGVTTEPEVQQKTLQTREALWKLPDNASAGAVAEVLKKKRIKPDTTDISVDEIRKSTGAPSGLRMVNEVVNAEIFRRQDEIREKVNKGFRYIEDPEMLAHNPHFRQIAQRDYYHLLFKDWGVNEERALITSNPLLERQVPLYRKPLRRYRIR